MIRERAGARPEARPKRLHKSNKVPNRCRRPWTRPRTFTERKSRGSGRLAAAWRSDARPLGQGREKRRTRRVDWRMGGTRRRFVGIFLVARLRVLPYLEVPTS